MSIIKSIQQVTITIAATSTSNTATINPVTVANAAVFLNGRTTTYSLATDSNVAVGVTLTNTTTVTATRTSTSNTVTVAATVVEFVSSVVNSVQYGTVAITASTTGTTSLGTAVGSNGFAIYLGSTGGAAGLSTAEASIVLTTGASSTVGATLTSSGTTTVYFCVVDLTSTAIASVQATGFSGALGSATTKTSTLSSSVTQADSIVVNNGLCCVSGGTYQVSAFTAQLTAANTVTYTRTTGTSATAALAVTVVQFQSGVLTANAVQRGTTTISSSATSNTSSITLVNTSFAFCNYCGFLGGASAALTPNEGLATVVLTNSTTETSTINTSGFANTSSWEVVEFASATTWTGTSTWPGVGTLVEGNESQIDVASATLGGVGTLVEAHETAIQSAQATLPGVGLFSGSVGAPPSFATLPGIGTLIEGGESQIDVAFVTLGGLGSFNAVAVPGVTTVSGGAADEVDPQTERRRRWLAEHDRELPRVRVVRDSKPQVTPELETQEAPPPAGTGGLEAPPQHDPIAAKLPAAPFIAPALSLLSSPAVGLIRAIKGRDNPPEAVSAAPLPPPPPPTFSHRLAAIAVERAAQRQRDDEDDIAAVLGMM